MEFEAVLDAVIEAVHRCEHVMLIAIESGVGGDLMADSNQFIIDL